MALDRSDGRVVWERTAREEAPHEASHQDNGTWASCLGDHRRPARLRVVRVARHVRVRHERHAVWQKDLGDKSMRNEFGEGSTPVLYRNRLVVVWDHTKGSFITALDKNTGNELWRVSRDEIDTWATPFVVEHDGRAQVIVPGMNRLHSYDLETGAGRLAQPGPDDEPDSVAGGRGRHRDRDQRLPRQQPEGDPHRRREGRSHGIEGDRVVARSRHAVRAVAASVRRLSVSAEEQLADSVGVRREDGQAALSAAAARRARVGSVLVAGRRRRARLHHRPRRHDARASQRRLVRSAREERAGRRVRRVAGAGRQRDVHARISLPLQSRGQV